MPPNLNSVHFKDFLFLSNWLNITHNEVQRSNLLTLILLDTVGFKTTSGRCFPFHPCSVEELIQEPFNSNHKIFPFHRTWERNRSANLKVKLNFSTGHGRETKTSIPLPHLHPHFIPGSYFPVFLLTIQTFHP